MDADKKRSLFNEMLVVQSEIVDLFYHVMDENTLENINKLMCAREKQDALLNSVIGYPVDKELK
jgi:hypothetical protein